VSEAQPPDRVPGSDRVTVDDVRAVTGAATPHFALQIRDRVRELIADLPADDPARSYGERKIAELEELAQHSGEPRGVK
jgi:hypothetical protein